MKQNKNSCLKRKAGLQKDQIPSLSQLLAAGKEIAPMQNMPLMWGVSRKRMFADLLGRTETEERLAGSLGIAAMAPSKGVDIIRVHDVREHADLYTAMRAID